jgi:hypothetical protein
VILECDYDEKIDIWSLGIILAKLLLPGQALLSLGS